MPSLLAFACLCGFVHGAGGASDDVKADWRRQYDAMVAPKGGLRPTDKAWAAIAADPQATLPLALAIQSADADELDDLLGTVKPPARFADCRPDFRVKEVLFRGPDGKGAHTKQAIFDGERMIGYLRGQESALWGQVRLFSMYPGHRAAIAPEHWADATDFRSSVRDYGDELTLVAAWGASDATRTQVQGGGRTLTFIRTDAWRPDGRGAGRTARAVHTVVLGLHPQLGYVLEHSLDWETDRLPLDGKTGRPIARISGGDLWGWSVVNPWPGEGTYAQAFFCPSAAYRKNWPVAETPFAVYWMNGPSVEAVRHGWHPLVRRGGLIGYLGGRDGWGVCHSVAGSSDVRAGVCPAWGEFHMEGPEVPTSPGADGLYRIRYRRRMAGLPPEIQDSIRAHAKVLFEDRRCLAIRLDGEDFEDQPLPFAAPHKGIHYADYAGRNVKLSAEQAHSGRQSIVAQGVTWEGLKDITVHCEHPPICLDPLCRYRLECWVRVEGEGTEGFCIAGDEKGALDKAREFTPAARLAAKEGIGRYRTASVTATGKWERVSLEFQAAPDGGRLAIGFIAVGPGRAWFDDFRMVKLPRAPPRPLNCDPRVTPSEPWVLTPACELAAKRVSRRWPLRGLDLPAARPADPHPPLRRSRQATRQGELPREAGQGPPVGRHVRRGAPGLVRVLRGPAAIPEERRMLTLWLDCLSPFYGWDQDVELQVRGEAVVPRIQFDSGNPLATEWREPRASEPGAGGPAVTRATAPGGPGAPAGRAPGG
jgi:hypothetical protein